jgi:hypothetical protein
MSMFCPKTHHDTMLHHYPSWMESVNDIASKLPASKSAHVGNAIPLDMYFGHLKRHVIESYSYIVRRADCRKGNSLSKKLQRLAHPTSSLS